MTEQQPPLLAAAQAYHEMGIPIIPFKITQKDNGEYEKTNLSTWKKWMEEPQSEEEFNALPWNEANAFGVILGTQAKNGFYLSVIDYDTKGDKVSEEVKAKGKEILKDFPITQTHETVNKGIHYVYWSRTKVETDGTFHDTAALELLGEKKLCLMPPSTGYQTLNDNSPTEIENLEETFYTILKKHGLGPNEENELQNQLDNYSFQLSKIIDLNKLTKISAYEYQGSHPTHDSVTEKNFCVNLKTNSWHCFRHNSGGGALQFLAVKEGLIKCEQAKKGALRGKKFHDILNIAVANGLLDEKVLTQSEINPTILAKDIMEDHVFAVDQDPNTLYCYNEKEGIYSDKTEQLIKRETAKRLDENFKSRYYIEINEFIKAKSPLVKMDAAQPELLPVKNGVLNVLTRELKPFNPDFYLTAKLNKTAYNKTDSTVWKTFLEQVIPSETQRKQVQELIGHCLVKEILTEVCLICLGTGGNGKSIFLIIIKIFLGGSKNVSSHTIQKLCYEKFVTAEIRGKLANISADLPQKELVNTGIFKGLVSGDSTEIYIKNVQGTSSIEPTCKYLFSANNTPPVASEEDCYAWYRRFVFADFSQTLTTENSIPRQTLIAQLSTPDVLSEILNWALDGLERLVRNGDISNRPSVEEIRLQYIRRSNSALAYFNDKVTITDSPDDCVFTDDWFRDYVTYCHNRKIKAKSQGEFTQTAKQHLPGAEKTRIRPNPKSSPLAAWRYVKFVLSVPTVPPFPKSKGKKKKISKEQKKLISGGELRKHGTVSTVGTGETRKCSETCRYFRMANCTASERFNRPVDALVPLKCPGFHPKEGAE